MWKYGVQKSPSTISDGMPFSCDTQSVRAQETNCVQEAHLELSEGKNFYS